MDSWINLWAKYFKMPLSGDVDEVVNTTTRLFSPQVAFNIAGDRHIESEVIQEVASYGTQLGLLSKVVLELAESHDSDNIRSLKSMTAAIEAVKKAHHSSLVTQTKSQLEQLKEADPDAFQTLLSAYYQSTSSS